MTTDGRLQRSAITSIFYLLCDDRFSAFHAIASDEIWHFYRGAPLALELIDAAGRHEQRVLDGDGVFQTTLPAGTVFAAHLINASGYALVGCDVGPGFDFADFEMPERAALIGPLSAARRARDALDARGGAMTTRRGAKRRRLVLAAYCCRCSGSPFPAVYAKTDADAVWLPVLLLVSVRVAVHQRRRHGGRLPDDAMSSAVDRSPSPFSSHSSRW